MEPIVLGFLVAVGIFVSVAFGFFVFDRLRRRTDTSALPEGTVSSPTVSSIPPWTGMTLDRWRESREHTDFANSLFRDGRFRQALEVLHHNLPIAPLSKDTNSDMQLGRLQGYREAIAVLMELPKSPPAPQEHVPADYSGDALEFDKQED